MLYTLSKEKFSEGWRWVLITMVCAGRRRSCRRRCRRRSRPLPRIVTCQPVSAATADCPTAIGRCCSARADHPSIASWLNLPSCCYAHPPTMQIVDYLQLAVFFIGNK